MKNLLQVFKTGESLRKRMMKIENSWGMFFAIYIVMIVMVGIGFSV